MKTEIDITYLDVFVHGVVSSSLAGFLIYRQLKLLQVYHFKLFLKLSY